MSGIYFNNRNENKQGKIIACNIGEGHRITSRRSKNTATSIRWAKNPSPSRTAGRIGECLLPNIIKINKKHDKKKVQKTLIHAR